jgi:hypothetical protein
MGYFPNSTAGMDYEEQYCSRCIHGWAHKEDGMCAVWLLHMLHNYKECNKPDSFLHTLIPLKKEGLGNAQCAMFVEDKGRPDPRQGDLF